MIEISQQQFDSRLLKLCEDNSIRSIIHVAGIYKIVSEYFNDQIIDEYESEIMQLADNPEER